MTTTDLRHNPSELGSSGTNYSKVISSRDVTECARLSRSRLRALFRIQTGLSPAKYLKEIRIRRLAQLLMADDSLSIEERRKGSDGAGWFTDKSNFTRSFKRVFGIAPSEYRHRQVNHALPISAFG